MLKLKIFKITNSLRFSENARTMKSGPEFYRLLEQYLKQLDPPMSFYKVSKATGQSTGHYSSWKHGCFDPSDNDLRKLAAIPWLNLTFEDLTLMRHLAKYGLPYEKAALRAIFSEDDLIEAIKILYPDPVEREAFWEKVAQHKPD